MRGSKGYTDNYGKWLGAIASQGVMVLAPTANSERGHYNSSGKRNNCNNNPHDVIMTADCTDCFHTEDLWTALLYAINDNPTLSSMMDTTKIGIAGHSAGNGWH